MNTVLIARTAGGKLAKRASLDLQAALRAVGIDVTVRVIRADFAEDWDVAVARLRARGVDAVEVSMATYEAIAQATRELAEL